MQGWFVRPVKIAIDCGVFAGCDRPDIDVN